MALLFRIWNAIASSRTSSQWSCRRTTCWCSSQLTPWGKPHRQREHADRWSRDDASSASKLQLNPARRDRRKQPVHGLSAIETGTTIATPLLRCLTSSRPTRSGWSWTGSGSSRSGEPPMPVLRYWTLVLALIALAVLGHTAWAQDATPVPAGVVLPPDAEVAGLSLAEWETRWWQWFESLPEASNPSLDKTGERCSYGQSGPVFFLASAPASVERTCTVPRGATLLVPVIDAECSTVEPPPFFARDEAELRACAVEAVNQAVGMEITAIGVRVDGQLIGDLA